MSRGLGDVYKRQLITSAPEGKRLAETAVELEARLTAKAMRILLGLLRLAVTQRPPVYQSTVLNLSLIHI